MGKSLFTRGINLGILLSAVMLAPNAHATQSAFAAIQAEQFDSQKGVSVVSGKYISNFTNSDYVSYSGMDFGDGAVAVGASMATNSMGTRIELHLDSVNGPLIGTMTPKYTGSMVKFRPQAFRLTGMPTGVHDLFLVAKGSRSKGVSVDWLIFKPLRSPTTPPPPSTTPSTPTTTTTYQAPPPTMAPPITTPPSPLPLDGMDAYSLIQAESFTASQGIDKVDDPNYVGYFDNGDYLQYAKVNFGSGAMSFLLNVGAIYENQSIELRIDSLDGEVIGTLPIVPTGDWNQFTIESVALNRTVTGVHDLYLIGRGSWGIGNLDSFMFGRATVIDMPDPMNMPGTPGTPGQPGQPDQPGTDPGAPIADLAHGRDLYEKSCSSCHNTYLETDRVNKTAQDIQHGIDNTKNPMHNLFDGKLSAYDLASLELALKDVNVKGNSEMSQCSASDLSKTTMRRMNYREFANSVKDLLGQSNLTPNDYMKDSYGASSFDTDSATIRMARADAEKVLMAAEKAVDYAMSNSSSFLNGCNSSKQKQSCIQNLLSPMMKKAYRRAITAADLKPLTDIAMSQQNTKTGVRDAVVAMIVSPHFLFHVVDYSKNRQGSLHTLSSYELASRLSFFLWSSIPDDELMQTADSGNLLNSATLKAQVARMLKSPKAKEFATNFAAQWLSLQNVASTERSSSMHPEFTPALRSAMVTEVQMMFQDNLSRNLDVNGLLTANFTFVDKNLAALYGLQYPSNGSGFQSVMLDGENRRGLLTQAGFMTATARTDFTNPIVRGATVLRSVMCVPLGPPPKIFDLGKVDPSGTMKERLKAHRTDASCASCHDKIDPIGLAFENFDAVGKWRTLDQGHPIDPSGTTKDGHSFQTPGQLVSYIASSGQFEQCIAQKVGSYGLNRDLSPGDVCEAKKVLKDYVNQPNVTLTDIIQGIVTSEFFRNSNVKD